MTDKWKRVRPNELKEKASLAICYRAHVWEEIKVLKDAHRRDPYLSGFENPLVAKYIKGISAGPAGKLALEKYFDEHMTKAITILEVPITGATKWPILNHLYQRNIDGKEVPGKPVTKEELKDALVAELLKAYIVW